MTYSPAIVLISVAPSAPYPGLYARGPAVTWANDETKGVNVHTFSGLPLTRAQRIRSDLREMLRFPTAMPSSIGTVNEVSRAMKAYGWLVSPASGNPRLHAKVLSFVTFKLIVLAGSVVNSYERWVASPMLNHRRPRVALDDNHLTVQLPATITNSLAIQKALMRFYDGDEISGILFITASGYLDIARFRVWVDSLPEHEYIAGSNALANPVDGSEPMIFFSGFCHYFSRSSIRRVIAAKDFDHSVPNDESWTRWFLKKGISWHQIGIVWNTATLEIGQCPLCLDSTKFVVRCTNKESRESEASFMQQLHHEHSA